MPGITSKLPEGWERSETATGIPYYINHETECTHWNHPEMVQLNQDIAVLNNIKYAAYRTAMKLRAIQKKTQMYRLELPVIVSSLRGEDIRDGYSEKTLTATDVQGVISKMFVKQNGDRQDFIDIPMASDLTFNWILNVFDPVRTGFVQSISLKVGLCFMCAANIQDKYKYIFRQLCNGKGFLDRRRLKLFLQEALLIPKNIYENEIFCGSSVEPAVRNCFERNASAMDQINLDEFLDWMIAEPQTIVWHPTLHRLAVSESVKHEAKCNICKMYPIVGFRYRCLKCFNFDLCQECFWLGRVNKGHKIGHPTQEYCLAPSQKEDIKDFAKVMKNKVSKKKKNPKDPSKGRYISIAPEDVPPSDEEEYSVDAPPRMKKYNSDTHDRLGSYATRIADYDDIDDKSIEPSPRNRPELDEHQESIHHYPSSRSEKPVQRESVLQLSTPTDVETILDPSQRDELEDLISNLENDNRALRDEIEKIHHLQLQNLSLSTLDNSDEADRLRQRKERLLAREEVLESHNHQLEIQLNRLRSLLHQDGSHALVQKTKSSRRTDVLRSPTIAHQPLPLTRVTLPQANRVTTEQNREHVPGLYYSATPQTRVTTTPVTKRVATEQNREPASGCYDPATPQTRVTTEQNREPASGFYDPATPHTRVATEQNREPASGFYDPATPQTRVATEQNREPASGFYDPETPQTRVTTTPDTKRVATEQNREPASGFYDPATPQTRVTVTPDTKRVITQQNWEHAPGFYSPAQATTETQTPSLQERSRPTMMQPSGTDRQGTEIRGVYTNQTRQPTSSLPGLRTSDTEVRRLSSHSNHHEYPSAVGATQYYSTPKVNGHMASNISFNASSPSISPLQRSSPSYPGFGGPRRLDTSHEEAELSNIVERMTSSFPLDAESDISMEIHSDLFLAAAMVGEAMQSLVSAVSRQRGQDISDSSLYYDNYTTDHQHTTNASIPMVRKERHSFNSSSGYVDEYGPS